jgi:hypothetical protein
VVASDTAVIDAKSSLHALSAEYAQVDSYSARFFNFYLLWRQIKAQYEAIVNRIHETNTVLDSKLADQDEAYKYVENYCSFCCC